MVLMFMPLSLATMGPLPKKDIPAASGFYNLTRQLGGSIGVALLTTILTQREVFHRVRLVDNISAFSTAASNYIGNFTSMFVSKGYDPATAHQMAMKMIDRMIDMQASVLSFADIFHLVAWAFILSLPLIFFLGSRTTAGVPAEVH